MKEALDKIKQAQEENQQKMTALKQELKEYEKVSQAELLTKEQQSKKVNEQQLAEKREELALEQLQWEQVQQEEEKETLEKMNRNYQENRTRWIAQIIERVKKNNGSQ